MVRWIPRFNINRISVSREFSCELASCDCVTTFLNAYTVSLFDNCVTESDVSLE